MDDLDAGFASDDDRVVPLHSFKHAAALQQTLPNNSHPLLIRIDKKAGHGAGKSTEQKCVCRYLSAGPIANELPQDQGSC